VKRTVKSFYQLLTFAAYGPKSSPSVRRGRGPINLDPRHDGRLYVGAKDRWAEENTDQKGDFKQVGFSFPDEFFDAQNWWRAQAGAGWDANIQPSLFGVRSSG